MALTPEQKYQIIYYLGWPSKTLDPDSNDYNSIVNDRLNGLNPATETIVYGILANLDALAARQAAASKRMGVKEIGDIVLNSDGEYYMLRKERMRLLKELAQLLNITNLAGSGGSNICVCGP